MFGRGTIASDDSSFNCRYTRKKADEIKAISLQSALDTVQKLETKLTDFAKQHQNDIRTDPVFRQRFLEMCAPLGVDPFGSEKSFWGSLLKMGDFYHELAVQVAEVCISSRTRNGGLISVIEVQRQLSTRRTRLGRRELNATDNAGNRSVGTSDIQVAIQKLSKLGGGFRTIQVGRSTMILSVPTELDGDVMQLMTMAQETSPAGGVSIDEFVTSLNWSRDRVQRALDTVLQKGMAWLDVYHGIEYYWFPASWQEEREKMGET